MTTRNNPQNWDDYQYGTSHRGSVSSAGGRSVRFDDTDGGSIREDSRGRVTEESGGHQDLRRRRSSIALRFNALTQVGGVNSIENFARSWTRAAAFQEITPQRSYIIQGQDQDGEDIDYGRTDTETGHGPRTSLLRQHLEASGSPEDAVDDSMYEDDSITPVPYGHRESQNKQLGADMSIQGSVRGSVRGRESIFGAAPHLASTFGGSYGTSYGTIRSMSGAVKSMDRAGELWKADHANQHELEGEHGPLLVKEVEVDGKVVLVVVGQSTLPQTIFNSTNVLIGVGLLSLPMGIKYAGWVCGMLFLALSALVTAYTAKLLAKCMDIDASMLGFGDIAQVAYGRGASMMVRILFIIELVTACVALFILFGDTLHLLIPGVGTTPWKILCGLILVPLMFAPLRHLSVTSILGIISCFSIVLIVFADGLLKPLTPGSLRDPADTFLWPRTWKTLPLSFGLLMSPWGGHGVFPNIYRDMRHPHRYGQAVRTTFAFTYILDCFTAVIGILMFGDNVMDEITANILNEKGYPQGLSIALCAFIAIVPLTKLPLNARPIVGEIELWLGLNQTVADVPALTGLSSTARGFMRIAIRVLLPVLFVGISILFPAFDSIMAFMGSSLCFTICVILPLLFYLKIFGNEISRKERILDWVLIVISSILAVLGTVFAFLPKSLIGADS